MRSLVVLLLLACTACASGAGPQGASRAAPAQASGTLASIRQLIGNAACADSSQCHSLPVGARGCGGPEYYLAWSSQATDGEQLRSLGGRYKAERQRDNAASGRVSDCRFAVDPGAACQAGSCRLNSDPLAR
jgi:hypothetical protein